ncbi:pyrroloquinoline quinone biosynthesis protein PqqB [Streptomyces sp. ISL-10]|uniref:pyrroloquinoline quinone biosynthesis protein PqqB n=1 Tax=Streptomyces sp. ISL-10 TaxID=2819172 RepID=UPI001BE6D6A4|nr:pyrroloquinoline quinone biosynthesis protein PqqB [Streptomyces sp. ISL-10]MBT2364397.1 pyrroloquinoline quinone biosynthesis protein PqqB [Streptomyces sp. ISL-10]
MLLQVLGTAAGGGLPQWNCACPGCAGARAHPRRRRLHASLAVRADERRWYLVGATPDIGEQIERCSHLHPGPGPRDSPVAGVVLTDAELDHTLGLARLREADRFEILATEPVRGALLGRLRIGETLAPYTRVTWRELGTDAVPLAAGATVDVSAVPVAAKRPRYAAGTGPDAPTWAVALRLHERATGRTLLYAPALAHWNEDFEQAAEDADVVIVDGTFWDDDEPARAGVSARTARSMGHLPIDGPNGTARRLAALRARCLYTHLNNTNPLTDPDAQQHAQLAGSGLEVAADGMVIEL